MNSPWTVLAIAIVIFFIELLTKGWNQTLLISLLVLVLLGAIFPPFAIAFGGAILLYLIVTRGTDILKPFTPTGGKK